MIYESYRGFTYTIEYVGKLFLGIVYTQDDQPMQNFMTASFEEAKARLETAIDWRANAVPGHWPEHQ